ncbi:MAG: hypothetical protein ACRC0G_07515 [Fusobacteriaceae bacterium]
MVNQQDLEFLLTMDPDKDVTRSMILRLVGNSLKYPPKYKRNEELVIPKNAYHGNHVPIKTTLGKFIYNRFVLEEFYDLLGYINEPVGKSVFGDIQSKLDNALTEDKITCEQYAKFIDKNAFFYGMVIFLSPSFTQGSIIPNKKTIAKRDELCKKYAKELQDGDAIVGSMIEKEVLAVAAQELKNDPVSELYESKASKMSFGNTYKNMKVMRGPIMDTSTGKFIVSTTNYTEGVKTSEIPVYSNIAVTGAYARGKSTQVGGYITKQFVAAFQTVVLDKKGSNCGTVVTTKVKVNKRKHKYRYILEGNKLVLLDTSNLDKYDGKVVSMRTPMYCKAKKICNVCAGELYYKLGIENIGLTLSRLSNSVMNAALKKSHDVTVQVSKVNIEELIL